MYVRTPQVTVENKYHAKVRDGGYAAIGPQSALHVGQSAVTNWLVYEQILSQVFVIFISICLFCNFPLKFRNVETVKGGKLRIFDLKCQ